MTSNEEMNDWCGTRDVDYQGEFGLTYLMKYAVPKLEDWNMGHCENGDTWATVHNGKELFDGKDKDPALALFWALYEVMKNEDKTA